MHDTTLLFKQVEIHMHDNRKLIRPYDYQIITLHVCHPRNDKISEEIANDEINILNKFYPNRNYLRSD